MSVHVFCASLSLVAYTVGGKLLPPASVFCSQFIVNWCYVFDKAGIGIHHCSW